MKKLSKVLGILLICLTVPMLSISAADGENSEVADVFSFENQDTGIGERIGHFAFWQNQHARIHKPFNQMTRIECGWNYYLMSLVDPVYEEALEDLARPNRVTSDSYEFYARYQSFDQQTGYYSVNLRFLLGITSIDVPFSIPYSALSGAEWPGKNGAYQDVRQATERALSIGRQLQSTNLGSLLFDVDYSISYIESSRRFRLAITGVDVYDRGTKSLIYSYDTLISRTFLLNSSDYSSYAGDVLFSMDALDRRVAPKNAQKFGLTSNPFGLSMNYEQLNRRMNSQVVAERNREIEARHEEEKAQVAAREKSMRDEVLVEYNAKKRIIDAQQAREDEKQARYDEEFEVKKDRILSKKPHKETVWNDLRKEKRTPNNSMDMMVGVAFPYGFAEEVPYGFDFEMCGGILYTPSDYGDGKNGVFIDAFGAGKVDVDLDTPEYKPETPPSEDPVVPSELNAHQVMTIYLGGGPGFAVGGIPSFTLVLSGGIAGGTYELDRLGVSGPNTRVFVEPAAKLSLTVGMGAFGVNAGVIAHGNEILGAVCFTMGGFF